MGERSTTERARRLVVVVGGRAAGRGGFNMFARLVTTD